MTRPPPDPHRAASACRYCPTGCPPTTRSRRRRRSLPPRGAPRTWGQWSRLSRRHRLRLRLRHRHRLRLRLRLRHSPLLGKPAPPPPRPTTRRRRPQLVEREERAIKRAFAEIEEGRKVHHHSERWPRDSRDVAEIWPRLRSADHASPDAAFSRRVHSTSSPPPLQKVDSSEVAAATAASKQLRAAGESYRGALND